MARPNSEIIQRKNIITQFNKSVKNISIVILLFLITSFSFEWRLGIKSIINLQMPGEHSHCGPPLEPSGFSYLPDIFMENQSKRLHFLTAQFIRLTDWLIVASILL